MWTKVTKSGIGAAQRQQITRLMFMYSYNRQ